MESKTAYEYIRDWDWAEEKHQADLLLDYCCTLDGNRGCQPMVDLDLALQKKLLPKQGGLLWLTFSRRIKRETVQAYIGRCQRTVLELGANRGYSFKLLHRNTYRKIVYFIFVST